MTPTNFPPRGIHPLIWKRIQAKRNRELKAEVRALYSLSPVLWAVVKGYDTYDSLLTKLGWSSKRLTSYIQYAIEDNYLHQWGNRYLPTQERHKVLKKRLSHR